jgi:dihydrodipicolinate synthase/N-acetylneuraminate lyase
LLRSHNTRHSYKPSTEALVEHYRAIGEASGGLPLFV